MKWNREAVEQCGHPCDAYLDGTGCQDGCIRMRPDTCRPRVFCASLADVFEQWDGPIVDHKGNRLWVDEHYQPPQIVTGGGNRLLSMNDLRRELFDIIDATANLDWLLLTKRPETISAMLPRRSTQQTADTWGKQGGRNAASCRHNVWLGTSVSDQRTANRMVPQLLKCRDLSPVLFLSCEPLLGPIDLNEGCGDDGSHVNDIRQLDWVIVGGESGRAARACRVTWIRDIVRQCADADVPCFVKQLGSNSENGFGRTVKLVNSKGADPLEWPNNIRTRQFPVAE